MPEMKSVYSSHLEAIGYDATTAEIHVKYQSGKPGVYAGVPPDVAAQVLGAASVGKELHRLVRGHYEFRYREETQYNG